MIRKNPDLVNFVMTLIHNNTSHHYQYKSDNISASRQWNIINVLMEVIYNVPTDDWLEQYKKKKLATKRSRYVNLDIGNGSDDLSKNLSQNHSISTLHKKRISYPNFPSMSYKVIFSEKESKAKLPRTGCSRIFPGWRGGEVFGFQMIVQRLYVGDVLSK